MTAHPRGEFSDLGGPVHHVDFGGPAGAPVVVCVHGLGGSHLNWLSLAPLLTDRLRVRALDLPGFGLSPANGRAVDVRANRDVVVRFVEQVAGEPVVLVGNSMGGLITTLVASRRPDVVARVVLIDAALPLRVAVPVDPGVLARFAVDQVPGLRRVLPGRTWPRTVESATRDILTLVSARPERLDPDVVAAHVRLARRRPRDGTVERDLAVALRSIVLAVPSPRLRAATHRVQAPVLMLHGDRDRLVPVGVARATAREHPHWEYHEARGVGHVPQLEDPAWTAAVLLDWLGRTGLPTGLPKPSGPRPAPSDLGGLRLGPAACLGPSA